MEKQIGLYVRVWQEPREGDDETAEWRGSVESVQNQGKRYFNDIDSLLAFLRDRIEDFQAPENNGRKYLE